MSLDDEYTPDHKAVLIDDILSSTEFVSDAFTELSNEQRAMIRSKVTNCIADKSASLDEILDVYRTEVPQFSLKWQELSIKNKAESRRQVLICILSEQYIRMFPHIVHSVKTYHGVIIENPEPSDIKQQDGLYFRENETSQIYVLTRKRNDSGLDPRDGNTDEYASSKTIHISARFRFEQYLGSEVEIRGSLIKLSDYIQDNPYDIKHQPVIRVKATLLERWKPIQENQSDNAKEFCDRYLMTFIDDLLCRRAVQAAKIKLDRCTVMGSYYAHDRWITSTRQNSTYYPELITKIYANCVENNPDFDIDKEGIYIYTNSIGQQSSFRTRFECSKGVVVYINKTGF